MSQVPSNLHRRIHSFAIRSGRMTEGQRQAYTSTWPQFGLDFSSIADQHLDPQEFFDQAAPLVLEIGFGMGQSLYQMALAAPNKNFIAIEVHRPGIGKLLQLIEQHHINNIRIFEHDAVEVLNRCLPDKCLDEVQIFFPDPWHKRKHHKRRLIQKYFINLMRSKIKLGGQLHLATDWQHYAAQMLTVMEASSGFKNCNAKHQYATRPASRPQTKFEQRGTRLGHEVWDLIFKKTSSAINSP